MSGSADLQRGLQSGHRSGEPVQFHREKSLGYWRTGLCLHLLRSLRKEMPAEHPDPGTSQTVPGDLRQLKSRFGTPHTQNIFRRTEILFFSKMIFPEERGDFSGILATKPCLKRPIFSGLPISRNTEAPSPPRGRMLYGLKS